MPKPSPKNDPCGQEVKKSNSGVSSPGVDGQSIKKCK